MPSLADSVDCSCYEQMHSTGGCTSRWSDLSQFPEMFPAQFSDARGGELVILYCSQLPERYVGYS